MLFLAILLCVASSHIVPPNFTALSFSQTGACCYNYPGGKYACGAGLSIQKSDGSFAQFYQKPVDSTVAGSVWPAGITSGGLIIDCPNTLLYEFTNLGCQLFEAVGCGTSSPSSWVFTNTATDRGRLVANFTFTDIPGFSGLVDLSSPNLLLASTQWLDAGFSQVCSYGGNSLQFEQANSVLFTPPPNCSAFPGVKRKVRHPLDLGMLGNLLFR